MILPNVVTGVVTTSVAIKKAPNSNPPAKTWKKGSCPRRRARTNAVPIKENG
jgi:hypothetical protein